MRTTEQIENLRKVFTGMYGPIMLFMSSEDINKMGDMVQQSVDRHTEWTWLIKIRTDENSSKNWNDIEKEPKMPRCTLRSISSKVEGLFPRYPKIKAILITAKEDEDLVFEFESIPS